MQVLLALALLSAYGREPTITHQESVMVMQQYASPVWERRIQILNPRRHPVWVYVECESRLTTNPIGIPGRHSTVIVLPDIPPGEGCLINHWSDQDGHSPKPWRP